MRYIQLQPGSIVVNLMSFVQKRNSLCINIESFIMSDIFAEERDINICFIIPAVYREKVVKCPEQNICILCKINKK